MVDVQEIEQSQSLADGVACSSTTNKFNGVIPTESIEKRYSLSSGPGGQNVQKNATKVEIRFKLEDADWLSDELKDGLANRLANRINAKGELIIESDRTRERNLNLADCFDKLRSTIYDVEKSLNARVETEEDAAILRKKAAIAAQRRLAEKRRAAEKRQMRSEWLTATTTCEEYSAEMSTTVRAPRERQFHVVPVPGVFTRGRWKCRDYREDDHSDRDHILDFTDKRETTGDTGNVAEKAPSNERAVESKSSHDVKESSTIVVTSIAPAPSTPQRVNTPREATERAMRDLERGHPGKIFSLDSEAIAPAQSKAAAGAEGSTSPADEPPPGNGAIVPTPNVVAIDNKIEQAMDLVKTHLTFAVREEVEVLRQTIVELEQRVATLESENQLLRQYAPADVLANIANLVQQRKIASAAPAAAQNPPAAAPPKK
ncbi:TSC-22/dip/bun family protein [Ancylostoma ceylanicum]|uniref:Large ribosomal subunit protein mL62 n=1 Tax=Ancylostoma ceylanicum TaxID=53326 RepID=A0A0D6LIR3_9BILA|nr:TSC-22/dip/bun family protein [Ancylostoma ceylanicum]